VADGTLGVRSGAYVDVTLMFRVILAASKICEDCLWNARYRLTLELKKLNL